MKKLIKMTNTETGEFHIFTSQLKAACYCGVKASNLCTHLHGMSEKVGQWKAEYVDRKGVDMNLVDPE